MQLMTRLGNGQTGVVELDDFTRIVNGQLHDNEFCLRDSPASYSNASTYIGIAKVGTPTSSDTWIIIKKQFDVNGHNVGVAISRNVSWDDRHNIEFY